MRLTGWAVKLMPRGAIEKSEDRCGLEIQSKSPISEEAYRVEVNSSFAGFSS
jgi:hypothetical protein